MILGKNSMILAEHLNLVKIINRTDFGPFSTDIRIDKLYKHTDKSRSLCGNTGQEIDSKKFIKYLEKIKWKDNKIILTPNDFYFFQPKETIELAPFFIGEVYSRSSWARLGCRASDDMSLRTYSKKRRKIKPLCILSSYGTDVEITKGDSIAQLLIKDDTDPFLFPWNISNLIKSGQLVIERNGKKLKEDELVYTERRPTLTMDNKIFVYTGGVLKKGQSNEDCFKEVDIAEKTLLPKGTFFLSSSAERIEIPEYCVGHVSEIQRLWPAVGHPNAPLIGPKQIFSGKITFENMLTENFYVQAGLPQALIHLIPIRGLGFDNSKSRYNNQVRATLGKFNQ